MEEKKKYAGNIPVKWIPWFKSKEYIQLVEKQDRLNDLKSKNFISRFFHRKEMKKLKSSIMGLKRKLSIKENRRREKLRDAWVRRKFTMMQKEELERSKRVEMNVPIQKDLFNSDKHFKKRVEKSYNKNYRSKKEELKNKKERKPLSAEINFTYK